MPTPTIAVFDLGKVLVDFDYLIATRRLSQQSALAADPLKARLLAEDLLHRYELGELSTLEFFEKVRQTIQYRGSFAQFAADFADIFTEIPEMIQLHARLRARAFPLYLLSNTNELAVQHIRRHFPFFAGFDGYALSYEQRAMKPQPRLYEVVERMSGGRGAQILYLDDFPPNVTAALARGWQAILHQTPAQSIAQVTRLLG